MNYVLPAVRFTRSSLLLATKTRLKNDERMHGHMHQVLLYCGDQMVSSQIISTRSRGKVITTPIVRLAVRHPHGVRFGRLFLFFRVLYPSLLVFHSRRTCLPHYSYPCSYTEIWDLHCTDSARSFHDGEHTVHLLYFSCQSVTATCPKNMRLCEKWRYPQLERL